MAYPLTSGYVDENGLQLILSDNIRSILSVDLTGTGFWAPDATYTGYAADGLWYAAGVPTAEVASWASELEGPHRGPLSRFPQQLLMVLTDTELSLIDMGDFTLFMRTVVTALPSFVEEHPGIFLDWVDDSSLLGLGSSLGVEGDEMVSLEWVNGIAVANTGRAPRLFNFKLDRGMCWSPEGLFTASPETRGLVYRNRQNYFGELADPAPGPSTLPANFTVGRDIGTFGYLVTEQPEQVIVTRWVNSFAAREEQASVFVGDRPVDAAIDKSGALFVLMQYDDGGGDRLKLIRSRSEWKSLGSGFGGTSDTVYLPPQSGGAGKIAIRGGTVFVAAGNGVYAIDGDEFDAPLYLYGSTTAAIEPVSPVFNILTVTEDPIIDAEVDPVSGDLFLLHGDIVDDVDVNRGQLKTTYTELGDPALPDASFVLSSFAYEPPEFSG